MIASPVTIYSAVTINAANNQNEQFKVTDLTAQTTWSGMVLHVQVGNNSSTARAGETIQLFYAFSVFTTDPSSVAISSPTGIRACAHSMTIPLLGTGTSFTTTVSPIIPATGTTLYTWFAHGDWLTTRTVSVIAAGM